MNVLSAKIANKWHDFSTNAEALLSKGNKAAGARSRKVSLELTALLKEWRKLSVKN